MRQWIGSTLVQIMACCLFGAKPLSKPMIGYCQLDRYEQTSFQSKSKTFLSRKCTWNIVCDMAAMLSRGRWVKSMVWELEPLSKQRHPCMLLSNNISIIHALHRVATKITIKISLEAIQDTHTVLMQNELSLVSSYDTCYLIRYET